MYIRRANKKDAELLSKVRRLQLIDEGTAPCNIDAELNAYFEKQLESENFLQLIAEEDGRLVSTAAIIYYDFPPSFTNTAGKTGYIANVYTAPEYRGRGFAKELVEMLIDEAKKKEIKKLWLFASKWGEALYKKFGFMQQGSYMEFMLEDKSEVNDVR